MISVYIMKTPIYEAGRKYENEHSAAMRLLANAIRQEYLLDLSDTLCRRKGKGGSGGSEEDAILKGSRGKPYLKDYPDIHFSLSHCRGFAACAVSDREVGVDAERFREVNEKIFQKVFTVPEQQFLYGYKKDPEKYREMFCRLWTLKESCLKQRGTGFFSSPLEVEFELGTGRGEEQFFKAASVTCSDKSLVFTNCLIASDCALSVCGYEKAGKIVMV